MAVQKVVIVGGGLAAVRVAQQLRGGGSAAEIVIVAGEPHDPYDRPPLSKQILAGTWPPERARLLTDAATEALAVEIIKGVPATGWRPGEVTLADGRQVHADAVVVATGAVARRLPGQPESNAVQTLRGLDDALRLQEALSSARHLVVAGGGFVGCEVASAAIQLGVRTTVVEAQPVPLTRVLGDVGGALCARLMTDAGVDLRVSSQTAAIADDATVTLADGSVIEADHVVVSIGSRADSDWLAATPGLDVDNGVVCDRTGRVIGAESMWALGDVAAWPDALAGVPVRHEHWSRVAEQAAVVAGDLLGKAAPPPTVPYFWSDQFGVKIQLVGSPDAADRVEVLDEGEDGPRGCVLGYHAGDRLVAALGIGAAKKIAKVRAALAHT